MQNLLKIGIETTDNDAIGKKNFFKSVPFWRTLSNCLKQRAILQMQRLVLHESIDSFLQLKWFVRPPSISILTSNVLKSKTLIY